MDWIAALAASSGFFSPMRRATVSYTHLDVYKRQRVIWCWSNREVIHDMEMIVQRSHMLAHIATPNTNRLINSRSY